MKRRYLWIVTLTIKVERQNQVSFHRTTLDPEAIVPAPEPQVNAFFQKSGVYQLITITITITFAIAF